MNLSSQTSPRPRAIWANSHFWTSPMKISGHHYARLLVEHGWDVAFVSDPISPFHLVKFDTIKETWDRIKNWARGGRRYLDDHLFAYTPFTFLPHYDLPILRAPWILNRWPSLTLPNLRRFLRRRGFDEPDLVVIDSINQAFWLDLIKPKKSVMRVVDNLSGFNGVSKAMIERERRLVSEVDHVVYTAHKLRPQLEACRPRSLIHVPNGVDLEHFLKPCPEPPAEYASLPTPRAVYVGAIDHWFDVALVGQLAQRLPDVTFVIIGPPRTNVKPLKAFANVHLLGPRPYAEVPRYLQHAQVGIIPFEVNDMIHAVHPIKLYEYMACGLPVVSVAWNELETMASPAHLCRNADEFAASIKHVLEKGEDRDKLVEYAKQADWRSRFATMAAAIGV